MSQPRGLSCIEQVNRPYDQVRPLLLTDPLRLLQRATTSAVARCNSTIATLRLPLAGLEIGVDVRVHVRSIRDEAEPAADARPVTRVTLSWEAIRRPGIFPAMLAELSARPVFTDQTELSDRTELSIDGSYWLPLGHVGNALDATIGHRIAESAVGRLLGDLVEEIQDELPVLGASATAPARGFD